MTAGDPPNDAQWYSTRLRLVCIVEERPPALVMDTVHVFRAPGWDAALDRALQLGRGHEQEYLNGEQQVVRWRLAEVSTLDLITADALDGAEVHSAFGDVPDPAPAGLLPPFRPERSQPAQTI